MKPVIGRPTKLVPALKKQAERYLLGDWQQAGDAVPSIAGLACYLGTSRQSVYSYAKADKSFMDTVEAVQTLQEKLLLNGGLKGEFNAGIVRLMLNCHGYSERISSDVAATVYQPDRPNTIVRIVAGQQEDNSLLPNVIELVSPKLDENGRAVEE